MDETRYWMALAHAIGPYPLHFAAAVLRFGSARAAWEAAPRELAAAALVAGPAAERLLTARAGINPDALQESVERAGCTVFTWSSPAYPPVLFHTSCPPPVLYCRGTCFPPPERAVAIVGTRRADPGSVRFTEWLARDLARQGVAVISGLALGVDAAAHRGALRGGGPTVAVLGSGTDVIYPRENRPLAAEIVSAGAVVSEHPPGTLPDAAHFPWRNRIISAFGLAVVVVQAGERSGALITADYALAQGRDVFAVPGDVGRPGCRGTNRLIADGAQVALDAVDVLLALDRSDPSPCQRRRSRAGDRAGAGNNMPAQPALTGLAPLSDAEEKVYGLLTPEPQSADRLAARSGLPAGTVAASLLMLEVKGLAQRVPGPAYIMVNDD